MSDQVSPSGPGWSVRVRDEAPPPAPAAPATEPDPAALDPDAPIGDTGPTGGGGFTEGTWMAGVGWIPADHPYATGQAKPPTPRRRRKGILSIGPSSLAGKIAFRVGVSASLGLILFGLFGAHSWITDLTHGKHTVTTPGVIAGEPLVTTGPLATMAGNVDGFLSGQPFVSGFAGGFYALPGAHTPSYGVFAFHHSGSSLTSDEQSQVVNDIAGGQYQGTVKSDTDSGVQYTCGNVDLGGRLGVACVWDDYDVAGFIIDFGDDNVDGVLSLAKIVRGAIESQTSSSSSSST